MTLAPNLRQAFHTTLAVVLSLYLALAFAFTCQSAFDHTQAPTGDKVIEHTVDSSGKFQKINGGGNWDTPCDFTSNFWNFNWLLGTAAYAAGPCDYNSQTSSLDNPPNHLRPEELASGQRIQDELGVELKPLDEQVNGDFVDTNNVSYDTMGVPNAYANWGDGKGFLGSIDKHLLKSVDHVVIDFTGSTPAQQSQVLDYLAGHSNQTAVDAIIFIGLD